MNTQELYEKLYSLRERLKQKYTANGRTPTICTDETLSELAKRAPRQKDDLFGINGIGETFVEKYGDYFMKVLNEYHASNISVKELRQEVKKTLSNLENRLVNISKKNRLLYMGKLYSKYAVDLYSQDRSFNQKILDLLMGKVNSLTLCQNTKNSSEEEKKRFKKVSTLLREIAKESRETGIYDLYVGYPYVKGKTRVEDFNVRAPLVLFPIEYDKQLEKIVIKLDKSKDILFNNNLILMQNKFLNINTDLPNNVLDDSTIKFTDFCDSVVKFYAENNINIVDDDLDEIEKFEEILTDDFPKYNNGEFYLDNNAILGKFSLYSSALQRDFKKMINSEDINVILDDLIAGIDGVSIENEDMLEEDNKTEVYDVKEQNLNYINELNSSQEQVLLNVDNKKELVIEGPPGTGKSQTITSLIADAVNKGKNVLMVSQKKAALDVIYSRLGTLANYALMLIDVKDKTSFYSQLKNLFSLEKPFSFNYEEFVEVSNKIDENINNFENINKSFFKTKHNGTEVYKIYLENHDNPFIENKEDVNQYYNVLNTELINIDFQELKDVKHKFEDDEIYTTCLKYVELNNKYNFLKHVKENLNQIERKNMQDAFVNFNNEQIEWNKLNFFKKLFSKGKRKKALKKLYKTYFTNKETLKQTFKDPNSLVEGSKCYLDFQNVKFNFNLLTQTQKKYAENLYNVISNNIAEKQIANEKLFHFISYCIIKNFEDENRQAFLNLNNFNNYYKQVNELILHKKDLTRDRFKTNLIKNFNKEIYNSKRYNEIFRQIESSRKWSVNKFINKFDFELFRGIKIWLMTPETVSEVLPFEYGLFDLLIFDEASQIYIEKGLPAISRARKVVIAGDHKQLRPSSLGFGRIDNEEDEESDEELIEDNAALEEESLLDLARFKYPNVMLNYHYRSQFEELINYSNYAFYNGKLNVSPNITNPEIPPIEYVKINNGLWQNRTNKNEALKVVEVVKKFLNERKKKETLGVITFNNNQRDLILDELERECLKDKEFANTYKTEYNRKENGEDVGLFVKNIENVQGDERDCIIFSIGYAKNESGKLVRNFGWLNQRGGENRLNVAITRAKRKIYIVSSILPQELVVDDLKGNGPKILRKYLEYSYAISNGDKKQATSILLSLINQNVPTAKGEDLTDNLQQQILKELTSAGLKVDLQVGVGNYKLDLAIKDEESNKYVLGIECDSKLYSNNIPTRERDVFRQKYFEARGWHTYRIWSSNWCYNKQKEVENILKLYNSLVKKD